MDRLHGFFVALEYLAICEFSVKDGPITYIQELQAFRRETQICSACCGVTSSSVRRSLALPMSIAALLLPDTPVRAPGWILALLDQG